MEPRPPNPSAASNPLTPPMAEAVSETGETASGHHTAAGDGSGGAIPPAPPDPKVGDAVGPYKLLGVLGKGGMATVYLAEETALKRNVALKLLSPATALSDPLAKARFVREAQAQAAVEHDHIIPIYAVGEAGGISFIAMPVLRGQTLGAALHQKPRPPLPELVRLGREMAEGLAAAHAKKLVHRDIKPSNVWLEGSKSRVKILDFGLAREVSVKDKELTVVGKVVGTPAYMSPEQAKGKPVDHRTDLFSLGVVLYQMATGQKPFTGDTSFEIMAAITTDEPFPVGDLAPDLPPRLTALINRLLAKDPNGRPQTAAQVVAELTAVEKGLVVPPVVVTALPATVPEPAAPNPFAEMDTTEKERPAAPPATRTSGRYASAEDRRRRDEEDEEEPARSGKPVRWGLIAAGVAVAALVVGLVWLAASALSPKGKETVEKKEKEPPKVVPPPKKDTKEPPPAENDRAIAETFVKNAKLKVLIDGSEELEVPANGVLPKAGRLTVTEIDFGDEHFDPTYTSTTFIPNLAGLKALREVRMLRWQLRLNAAQVNLLAGMPLANTLERFDARVELTPASLDALKKFPRLMDITVSVPEASDELFKRLAKEMPDLKFLTLFSVPDRDELTDDGWRALGKMKKMTWITLVRCPAGANAFRVLTAKGATEKPGSAVLDFQVCGTIDDDTLLELSKRPTDVKILSLRSVNVTDKGLGYLAEVKSLKKVTLNQTGVTEKGVKALKEARAGALEVVWDGKPFEPEK